MGRVKQYSKPHQHKKKKRADRQKTKSEGADKMEESDVEEQPTSALTVGKQKQIFKKEKAKKIKQKITELKQASLKLKKKNLDQKAEKKKIAKEIHRLKACLKESRGDVGSDESEDDEKMDA